MDNGRLSSSYRWVAQIVHIAWHWPDCVYVILRRDNPWQQRLRGREPMLRWLWSTTELCVSGTEMTLPHVCNGSVACSYSQLNFLLMCSLLRIRVPAFRHSYQCGGRTPYVQLMHTSHSLCSSDSATVLLRCQLGYLPPYPQPSVSLRLLSMLPFSHIVPW